GAALKRSIGLVVPGQIEDQEWRVGVLGANRRCDLPAGALRGVGELVRERGIPGDHDHAVPAAGARRLGIRGTVFAPGVVVVTAPGLAAQPTGGDRAHADGGGAPARLAKALLVERARDVEADVDS